MADTRINALSTATVSLSDDYLPIDGTTAGTKKLSAFSPSFGGNATVGGTLTVSGSGTSAIGGMLKGAAATYSGNPPTGVTSAFQVDVENATTRDVLSFGDASRAGLLRGYHDGSGGIRWQFGRYAGGAYDEYARFEGTTAANGKLLIYGTTASTSTSSGALVVSGGVGVGGAIYVGGAVDITGQLNLNSGTASAPSLKLNATNNGLFYSGSNVVRVAAGGSEVASFGTTSTITGNTTVGGTLTVNNGGTAASAGVIRLPNNDSIAWRNAANSADVLLTLNSSNNLSLGSAAAFYVNNSTASTSTSSGALVVSGGVGVAGAVNVGTYLKLSNASQNIAAWGDIGPQFSISGSVLTDTTSSGTVPRAVVNSIASTAIAASSTTTYTQAATLFIAAAPTANTNVTITNAYAIYTAGGRINFQGLPTSSAGLQAGTLWNDGGTLKVA